MSDQKEKILQFGAGKFLRAFLDLFVQEAAEAGENPGRVVVVQSTPGVRAGDLAARGCSYHVLLRGISDGEQVDSVCRVDSISRALVAGESWQEVLDLARSEDLEVIVSNTTEKGYEVDETGFLSTFFFSCQAAAGTAGSFRGRVQGGDGYSLRID